MGSLSRLFRTASVWPRHRHVLLAPAARQPLHVPGRSQSSSSSSSPSPDPSETHFGFQTVTEQEKSDKVLGVFHNVAEKYDLMNDAMSFGVHRCWKDHFVRTALAPSPGTKLLDVAGGTGDIAFRFLDVLREQRRQPATDDKDPQSQVVCCDINESMLSVGQQRAKERGYTDDEIRWQLGDAQQLPFEDESFDAYTIAFGIRNVVRIEKALSEAHRVLRPGGRFLCLEFSHVDSTLLAPAYDLYSFQVIPPMGKILAGDWESYQYLVESIRKFPDQETFRDMIQEAGFKAVTYENLTLGVAAVHSGFKL